MMIRYTGTYCTAREKKSVSLELSPFFIEYGPIPDYGVLYDDLVKALNENPTDRPTH